MRRILRHLVLSASVGASFAAAGSAHGADVGVGMVAGQAPGISVQLRQTEQVALHATTRYGAGAAGFGVDYQRFLHPSFARGRGFRTGLYAGAGIAGAARRDRAESKEAAEDYHLRLPVGAQLTVPELSFSLFTEVAAAIGPLPETAARMGAAVGARAEF